ncbi:MORN repeat-containing protein 3 [Drosophila miranda]|uniref:MORN repeat-containing protein 3 n=1 Tax=Drosophila miranda TaxID=7229 RepID=UPI00143FAFF3|nr:MORN repeat-containing protein 3 [Drosophila miranda]
MTNPKRGWGSVVCNMSCHAGGGNGVRSLRYPAGGHGRYQGKWLRNQHHGYGVKSSRRGLVYEGQWQRGQRHGYGSMRRESPDGQVHRLYVGHWRHDKRSGEGKQYYDDGYVYFGQWQMNKRQGRGIHWYADGRVYVGEWLQDAMHGRGVLFSANGKRYVGEFQEGCKSGAGFFDHGKNRIQFGRWVQDICKSSLIRVLKQ